MLGFRLWYKLKILCRGKANCVTCGSQPTNHRCGFTVAICINRVTTRNSYLCKSRRVWKAFRLQSTVWATCTTSDNEYCFQKRLRESTPQDGEEAKTQSTYGILRTSVMKSRDGWIRCPSRGKLGAPSGEKLGFRGQGGNKQGPSATRRNPINGRVAHAACPSPPNAQDLTHTSEPSA